MSCMRAIFNPRAAGGRGARLEPDVRACLARAAREADVKLEWVETQEPGHAVVLAQEAAANGCDLVVAIGGDGTVNEVINGLMQVERRSGSTALGIIPVGSGNDFAWNAGIALDPLVACQRVIDGQMRVVDLGQIRESSGRQRYFCNGSGAGFDAQTALEVERFKWLRGVLIYLVAVLKTLIFHHQVPELRISVDDREWTQRSMMLTVGNGRRLGGGFLVTPEAELDDGLLDVCICGELGRLGILMIIPRFMRGTHVTHREVQMARARRVKVESPVPLAVHLEGESFATDAREFEFSIIPAALRLRV
jgi:diacylglycerol kinase (ATP)